MGALLGGAVGRGRRLRHRLCADHAADVAGARHGRRPGLARARLEPGARFSPTFAESGRFSGEEGEELVDRMAILPGQLTAYDSGGLEIRALREEAERELGAKFDIKGFHKAVLELGVVPLPALRENVQAWIAAEKAKGK